MKRAALLSTLALLCGLALGFVVGNGVMPSIPFSASASARSETNYVYASYHPTPVQTEVPLDPDDNTPLLERAGLVLEALKAEDYAALAQLVHPEQGVTLTPYSTVDPACDNAMSQEQVRHLAQDEHIYTWGLFDGSGIPIRCTPAQYFQRYVFNADFTTAPQVGIDTVLISGNALENVAEAYPEGRFVEYHFPGIDPELKGFDWCSLKLIFEVWNNEWYLVGIVHGEWTI
mgnify:CR=1 FL=1|nr:hypothetical protein [uncultured Flavonifractor sp.]